MENNTLVIELSSSESSSSRIEEYLKCRKLEYSNKSKDHEIHDWLLENKQSFDKVEKIIIPIRLAMEDADYMGLYVGLHIRLTKELGDARFLPMLFITEDTKEEILINQINNHREKSGLLLFTKGSYLLSAFSLDEYISNPLEKLNDQSLREDVIPNLNISNTKDPGHQLANEWGVFRLAECAGHSLSPKKKPKSLYFKFKDSITNNGPAQNTNPKNRLEKPCKALLIDDNAALGWDKVLEYILKNHVIKGDDLEELKTIESYEKAEAFAEYVKYDIVFLDLRLDKKEDKANHTTNIDEFTGAKILKKIKEVNRGIQVIIFTASNKAWNIGKLLELGANGYYIKESPEYTLNARFSKDNHEAFIETIKRCLSRERLKGIWDDSQTIKSILEKLSKHKKINKGFKEELSKYIDLGYKNIDAAKEKDDFAMAYIVLFKCIERINDEFVKNNEGWKICINESECWLKGYKYKGNRTYDREKTTEFKESNPNTFEKILGLGFQKLQLSDEDGCLLYDNVRRRNHYIHPKDIEKDEKKENEKIYDYEGYRLLMSSLLKITKQFSDETSEPSL